ncbi:DsrE family protein [Acidihalobacter prosperus]|uniref:Uncharacterized protein n=1 Tax=Acidihalobacter prosperus TaxID=160660 RepID=A0A1A6C4F2_9GAMM|nr:DsrE family protein [Acidihalobacter prosperus]OBS09420.1 hypothetical protein Thpro_021748 [Acidihalobacter prosperus]
MKTSIRLLQGVLLLFVVGGSVSATVAAAATQTEPVTVHMLVMVDRSSPEDWMVAMNLLRHTIRYQGIDHSELELMAIGPGMKLLLKGTPYAQDIQSLAQYGVQFVLCRRNLAAAHIPVARAAAGVGIVGDSVVELQRRQSEGWVIAWP